MPLTVLTDIKIMAGESLSNGVDCSGGTIVKLTMPVEWTPANMTFQFSSDGNGYNDMFDQRGKEMTLPSVPGGVGIVLDGDWLSSLAFIKIRSGTRTHPVKQLADREFAIAVQTEG